MKLVRGGFYFFGEALAPSCDRAVLELLQLYIRCKLPFSYSAMNSLRCDSAAMKTISAKKLPWSAMFDRMKHFGKKESTPATE